MLNFLWNSFLIQNFFERRVYSVVPNIIPEFLWWGFNEGSGTDILAEHGPDGTANDDGLWVEGKADYAMGSDGPTITATANSDIAFGVSQLTMCFWFYGPSAWPGSTTLQSCDDKTTTDGSLEIAATTDVELKVIMRSYFNSISKATIIKVATPPLEEWIHVAITMDTNGGGDGKGAATVYYNGVQAANSVNGNTRFMDADASRVFQIPGLKIYSSILQFLDDFRIYTGLLTVEQIQAVMANPA